MPLVRDKIVGHDSERFAFRFTMLNNGEVVQCQISDAALDELAGMKGTEGIAREAQFVSLRNTIEKIPSVCLSSCHELEAMSFVFSRNI